MEDRVSDLCRECGASVPVGGKCRDNFDAMLALEWEVAATALQQQGELAHFFTVSSYILQHPDSMCYTIESLAWLRSSVRSALSGQASVGELRTRARGHGEQARVTRREGDPIPHWDVHTWSTTVADILAGGIDGYGERAQQWAASVISDLDAADA